MQIKILPIFVLLLLVVIPAIILFVKLFSKRPWIGGFVALGLLSVFALAFFFLTVRHRQVVTHSGLHFDRGSVESESKPAAIWQPGIEDEFEANVYPSKLSAVRSLGLRIGEPIRQLFGDQTWPNKGILFQGSHEPGVLDELIKAIARKFPETQWTIAPETVAVEPNEVGIRLDLSALQAGPTPWNSGNSRDEITRGTVRASVLAGDRQIGISAEFAEKPWIENFDGVWNNRPNGRFIAKSAESCVTREEAERQAIENACCKLTDLLRQTPRANATPSVPRKVTANDVLEREFVLDRFSQKFEGRAGEIWRHALLIDASVGKLEQLARHKTTVARQIKWSWARMLGSVIGLLALITVVYAFLNAATKGYYAWSLRIAGIVLATAIIILFVA
ncbi:MAG: hypothetical protein H8E73_03445 [Planctomycetes bacterium]|nr:hypothetical protein [Planctomycetota bacterium]MBL7188781.1 hypothetical protein [Phycisphaerae bacterium]